MNAIEIKNLTKKYPSFTLDGLSLTLPQGCIMGLIGENGAGKSTTIKSLLGIIFPDSGSISLLGADIADKDAARSNEIGVVLDESGLPDTLNMKQIGKIMQSSFTNWDAEEYANLCKRFALPEKQKLKTFSKGMKMKAGIAVALSHNAKLLILDEPTGGLDPIVRDEIVEMIGEFTRDESRAVLISSHIVSDLEKICDYIAFLHEGKLLLCEEKDRLLEEYACVLTSPEILAGLEEGAVLSSKESPYGAEAVVRRDRVPESFELKPVTLEELFIAMVKEAAK